MWIVEFSVQIQYDLIADPWAQREIPTKPYILWNIPLFEIFYSFLKKSLSVEPIAVYPIFYFVFGAIKWTQQASFLPAELRNGWLICTASKSFAVYAATSTEKQEWMAHINKCIEDLLKKSKYKSLDALSYLTWKFLPQFSP